MGNMIDRDEALYALHNDVGLGTAHPAYECIAALPAVTVGVKPLVWERYGIEDWKAASPFGEYRTIRNFLDMSVLWLGEEKLGTYGGGSHTLAQAAAQEDYNRRSATLAPQPAPDPAAIRAAALREAAAVAKEISDQYVGYMGRIEHAILALLTEKPHD